MLHAHRYGYVTEKGRDMNTGDLSFCALFKTDTGYAEGSRALMFFSYIRILHKYVMCFTHVLHVFVECEHGMGRLFLSQVFVCPSVYLLFDIFSI